MENRSPILISIIFNIPFYGMDLPGIELPRIVIEEGQELLLPQVDIRHQIYQTRAEMHEKKYL